MKSATWTATNIQTTSTRHRIFETCRTQQIWIIIREIKGMTTRQTPITPNTIVRFRWAQNRITNNHDKAFQVRIHRVFKRLRIRPPAQTNQTLHPQPTAQKRNIKHFTAISSPPSVLQHKPDNKTGLNQSFDHRRFHAKLGRTIKMDQIDAHTCFVLRLQVPNTFQ